jgi:hypothetical protein
MMCKWKIRQYSQPSNLREPFLQADPDADNDFYRQNPAYFGAQWPTSSEELDNRPHVQVEPKLRLLPEDLEAQMCQYFDVGTPDGEFGMAKYMNLRVAISNLIQQREEQDI